MLNERIDSGSDCDWQALNMECKSSGLMLCCVSRARAGGGEERRLGATTGRDLLPNNTPALLWQVRLREPVLVGRIVGSDPMPKGSQMSCAIAGRGAGSAIVVSSRKDGGWRAGALDVHVG